MAIKNKNYWYAGLTLAVLGFCTWAFQNCGSGGGFGGGTASATATPSNYELWNVMLTGSNVSGQCGGLFSESYTIQILYSGSLASTVAQSVQNQSAIAITGAAIYTGTESVGQQSVNPSQVLVGTSVNGVPASVQSTWAMSNNVPVISTSIDASFPLINAECLVNGQSAPAPATAIMLTATAFNSTTLTGTWTAAVNGNAAANAANGTFTMQIVAGGTTNNPIPGPQGLFATVADKSVTLGWNAYPGASIYKIYYSAASTVTVASALNSQTSTLNQTTIGALSDGSPYAFIVTAVVNGTETEASSAIWVIPDAPVVASHVTAGQNHACAIVSGGQVFCWGSNVSGQLGNGSVSSWNPPSLVTGMTTAIGLSAGNGFTCAVLAGGIVQCWGSQGGNGQLGNNSINDSPTPVTVTGLTNVVSISSRSGHSCAVRSDHSVYCWGTGTSGELGNGSLNSAVPILAGLSGIVSVAAGAVFTCAVTTNGGGECWGRISSNGLANVTALAGGDQHACGALSSGVAECWGLGSSGQLGNGSITVNAATPVAVQGLSNVGNVATGADFSCAALNDGTVTCWGANGHGQLGNNSIIGSTIPVSVLGLNHAVMAQFAAGGEFACIVTNTGGVACWGANDSGQLGNGYGGYSAVPVVVSE